MGSVRAVTAGRPSPYFGGLIIGLFLYEFFSDATKTGLLSPRAKGYLLTTPKFPSRARQVAERYVAPLTEPPEPNAVSL